MEVFGFTVFLCVSGSGTSWTSSVGTGSGSPLSFVDEKERWNPWVRRKGCSYFRWSSQFRRRTGEMIDVFFETSEKFLHDTYEYTVIPRRNGKKWTVKRRSVSAEESSFDNHSGFFLSLRQSYYFILLSLVFSTILKDSISFSVSLSSSWTFLRLLYVSDYSSPGRRR